MKNITDKLMGIGLTIRKRLAGKLGRLSEEVHHLFTKIRLFTRGREEKAVDHHASSEGLHQRDTLPEIGGRYGHGDPAAGVGALREGDGRRSGDGGLRSWRRRTKKSSDTGSEGNQEWDFSERERGVDWTRTEHGSQGPPGTGALGGRDRDDQECPLWLQQTASEVVGRVCLEGVRGDIGSEFDPPDERLAGPSGNGGIKTEGKRSREREKDNSPTSLPRSAGSADGYIIF